MPPRASRLLDELASLKTQFGREPGRRKRELLSRLERARLADADQVATLHELLCFWRAYPDSRPLRRQIDSMLVGFETRADLRSHRNELVDSGIAGTAIRYEFFMQMAQWVANRWPDRLSIDWSEDEEPIAERVEKVLNLLGLYCETPGLDEMGFDGREWLALMKGPAETDGTFLARRVARVEMDTFVREYLYEHLAVPMVVAPGPDGPSRTRARVSGARVHLQSGPLKSGRPDLPKDLRRPADPIVPISERKGQEIIDLAREAMITRSRDLDAFAFADPRDVRLIDCGDGLQFAALGMLPERRLMFEAVYGFLTLMNGVPIGYVLNSALFNSVEVAYNVFETYRGAEAGYVYGRLLKALRHVFGADTFTIYPYQLGGEGNQEGLQSGAWWFYQKLGFRARGAGVLRLMRRELGRMQKRRKYRTSIAVLEELATENVYYELGRKRDDVIGMLPLGEVGLKITEYLSKRFGSDRHRAGEVCGREAMKLLGLRSLRGFTDGERLAWARWAPLALILPGVKRWSTDEKAALAKVMRAKGGRRESDFVRLFDGHRKLRRAVRRLAEAG